MYGWMNVLEQNTAQTLADAFRLIINHCFTFKNKAVELVRALISFNYECFDP